MNTDNTLDMNDRDSWFTYEFIVFGRYRHGPKAGSINRKSIVTMHILAADQRMAVSRITALTSDRDDKGRIIPGTAAAFQLTRRVLSTQEALSAKARAEELSSGSVGEDA